MSIERRKCVYCGRGHNEYNYRRGGIDEPRPEVSMGFIAVCAGCETKVEKRRTATRRWTTSVE